MLISDKELIKELQSDSDKLNIFLATIESFSSLGLVTSSYISSFKSYLDNYFKGKWEKLENSFFFVDDESKKVQLHALIDKNNNLTENLVNRLLSYFIKIENLSIEEVSSFKLPFHLISKIIKKFSPRQRLDYCVKQINTVEDSERLAYESYIKDLIIYYEKRDEICSFLDECWNIRRYLDLNVFSPEFVLELSDASIKIVLKEKIFLGNDIADKMASYRECLLKVPYLLNDLKIHGILDDTYLEGFPERVKIDYYVLSYNKTKDGKYIESLRYLYHTSSDKEEWLNIENYPPNFLSEDSMENDDPVAKAIILRGKYYIEYEKYKTVDSDENVIALQKTILELIALFDDEYILSDWCMGDIDRVCDDWYTSWPKKIYKYNNFYENLPREYQAFYCEKVFSEVVTYLKRCSKVEENVIRRAQKIVRILYEEGKFQDKSFDGLPDYIFEYDDFFNIFSMEYQGALFRHLCFKYSNNKVLINKVFSKLSSDYQINHLYYFASKNYQNIIEKLEIKNVSCTSRVYMLLLLLQAKNKNKDEKKEIFQQFCMALLKRANFKNQETIEQEFTLTKLLPECDHDRSRLQYCEGIVWKDKDKGEYHSKCVYSIHNKLDCHKCYLYKKITNKNEQSKYWEWTLYDVLKYAGFLKDDEPEIVGLPKKYKIAGEVVSKIAGLYNQFNEIREHMRCEKCNVFMSFDAKYPIKMWRVNINTWHICPNCKNKVYINHCHGYDCGKIIDSRIDKQKSDVGYYICMECGSAGSGFEPGSQCPNCGEKNTMKEYPNAYSSVRDKSSRRKLYCSECGHSICTPPRQNGIMPPPREMIPQGDYYQEVTTNSNNFYDTFD